MVESKEACFSMIMSKDMEKKLFLTEISEEDSLPRIYKKVKEFTSLKKMAYATQVIGWQEKDWALARCTSQMEQFT